MSLMNAKVGDTVMVSGRGHAQPRETSVAKVGRKYLYLQGGGVNTQSRFSRETGREITDYGYSARVYLPDEWAALQRRNQVVDRLRLEHGLRSANFTFSQSTETLEAILQILDAAEKETQR